MGSANMMMVNNTTVNEMSAQVAAVQDFRTKVL